MAEKQIFIIGTGRTGSTVLRRILGGHSRIYAFPTELRFLSDNDGLFDLLTHLSEQWNPFNASLAIHRFRQLLLDRLWKRSACQRAKSSFYVRGLGGSPQRYGAVDLGSIIPRDHCRRTLDNFTSSLATVESGSWYGSPSYQRNPQMYVTTPKPQAELYDIAGKFVDDLLSYPLKGAQKTCWCDDTPINILNGGVIAQMFDQPRLLHLYRDPRDVIASYVDGGQSWAPEDPVLSSKWILEIMRSWWHQRGKMPSKVYREICYEDLVRDQATTMKALADFLGVEHEMDSLMSIELSDTSVGRYKKDLTSCTLAKIESIVSPIIEEYGYE